MHDFLSHCNVRVGVRNVAVPITAEFQQILHTRRFVRLGVVVCERVVLVQWSWWCCGVSGSGLTSASRCEFCCSCVAFSSWVFSHKASIRCPRHENLCFVCVFALIPASRCVTTECEDVQNVQRATVKRAVFQGSLQTLCR